MFFLGQKPLLTGLIHMVNSILTATVFVLYPLLLVWLGLNYPEKLYRATVVPLDSFLVVTVIRCLINRRRPYEAYGIPPAIHKSTAGKSCPSRHVFSAFVIAVTFLYAEPEPVIGVVLILAGGVLGAIRVLTGVHYVSDVLAGAACGILAGIVGYVLL
jgi:membrane-associated phospholipid phosphatase